MKKIFFVFSILALIVLIVNFVFASAPALEPPAPAPECYIKGIIQSVEFKEAYNDSCLTDCPQGEWCCPTDMELEHPDRYFLNITIKEISYIEGTTEFSTCEELFPVSKERVIFINKDDVKEGDIFKINQQIEGQTPPYHGIGIAYSDSYLESYILKELADSNAKIRTYIMIGVVIALLLIIIIYFLKK